MLKLFHSIFSGGRDSGRYPEALIEAAIERAVDGTDPRLRAVPGYRRRLREPVIHAADHVVALVDRLPEPLAADTAAYAGDARLATLFASPESMREAFGNDPSLGEYRSARPGDNRRVTALLLAERLEKNVLGVELAGTMLRRDVPQVAVSFRGHRLVDPFDTEEETRRQLKRRAFDHLLSLALLRITGLQSERADLNRQRDLLRCKLRDLDRGGWSFDASDDANLDPAALQASIETVEGQLAELGADQDVLKAHLDITADLLGDAENELWCEDVSLYIDRMNIRREAGDASARAVDFHELHNARGRHLVMLLLSIAPDELPEREDFFTAAQRLL